MRFCPPEFFATFAFIAFVAAISRAIGSPVVFGLVPADRGFDSAFGFAGVSPFFAARIATSCSEQSSFFGAFVAPHAFAVFGEKYRPSPHRQIVLSGLAFGAGFAVVVFGAAFFAVAVIGEIPFVVVGEELVALVNDPTSQIVVIEMALSTAETR